MKPLLRKKPVLFALLAVLKLGLAACEQGTAGPEAGADVGDLQNEITALREDVGAFSEQFEGLDERVTALEDRAGPIGEEATTAGLEPEILAAPDEFVGEQVTVSAEANEVISTNAFTLRGPAGELLVTSVTGAGDSEFVENDAVVQVTGTVRERFSVVDFESEFGVDLQDELFTEFEQRTYIVADSVGKPSSGG